MNQSPPLRQGRCAIYTRKSTEEGLEQAFNSLDAQREACEAYILSQKHEGWTTLPRAYDDGGFSGGSMDRPGLRQLLADVEAGAIDVVVVYKVDRLTRALADFARIVAIFDAAGVSFVSVTQAFNTTTSMGRLTLLNETTDQPSLDASLSNIPLFPVVAPLRLQRRGPELRLVLQGAAAPVPKPDPLLLRTLVEARAWVADYLDPVQALSVSAIAGRANANVGDVSRSLQLAFLAPHLVEAILDGTLPVALTAERLKRSGELPLLWDEQRARLS